MLHTDTLYLLNDNKTLINLYKINNISINEDGTGTIFMENSCKITDVSKDDISTIAKLSSDNIVSCNQCGKLLPSEVLIKKYDRRLMQDYYVCEECQISNMINDYMMHLDKQSINESNKNTLINDIVEHISQDFQDYDLSKIEELVSSIYNAYQNIQ